ncbi:MAG: 5-(carboxyamino)imidazole ribonucleotide mutase [Clostridia bacterium]|nr:5-(carboxyamino)imidazole ribonucleotide mutase [Clostridia bacterium]
MEVKPLKRVAIIMGSDSDLPVVKACADKLSELGVGYEMHIMSAHRTPSAVSEFASSAEQNGFGVIIAAAGKAAHLGGFIAAHTVLPVIGVPLKSSTLDGLDALLATVQMPSGIPVATVAIDGAANAAILAAEILALGEPELFARLVKMRQDMAESVRKKDAALCAAPEKP